MKRDADDDDDDKKQTFKNIFVARNEVRSKQEENTHTLMIFNSYHFKLFKSL